MNWGNKILIGFSLFVVGIGSMVYIAMKQTNEMVDGNYYEKELAYQGKIDAAKNLNAIQQKVEVKQVHGTVQVSLPLTTVGHQPKGKLEFLRPSKQSLDVAAELNVDANGLQSFSKQQFVPGTYQLRIEWANNGTTYYYNQPIIIQP